MEITMTIAQKQTLSQHMQLSAQILQMGTLSLFEYIQEVAMTNPVVEWEEMQPETQYEKVLQKLEWLDASDEQNRQYYQAEQEDKEENDDWKFKQEYGETLEEYLLSQINILPITDKNRAQLFFLTESLDRDGYLEQASLDAMEKRFFLEKNQTEEILKQFQSLEPAGVGARNLQECLLLQLQRQKKAYPLCEKIIEKYLSILAKNQLHIIAKELKVKMVEVLAAKERIQNLSPKPGRGFSSEEKTDYIIPDILVTQEGETVTVLLNNSFLPKLKINGYYREILRGDTSEGAKKYITERIQQAEWVMQCIVKRESTLLKTAEAIVVWQNSFFQQKEALVPMRMHDIANSIHVHESTVSRTIRDKYLQCSHGVFPLSYFFTTGVATKSEEMVSASQVKKQLEHIIAEEDKKKPYSDRILGEKLSDMGIEISRRTVAKYREELGIAGASGRKVF